jgi:DNA invertase Pin-like site-specific DNA recombinase
VCGERWAAQLDGHASARLHARCSTDKQDLAAQRHTLRVLGVGEERVYLDHGMTGRNRRRPGLEQALAAVREGDTLVVAKLDRLAQSVPDARANGRLKGKTPKLSARQRVHVLNLAHAGDHTIAELAELFSVSRATIYRDIARARGGPT